MVATARQYFEQTVRDAVSRSARALPDDVVVVFHIEGPGGGSWQVEGREGDTVITGVSKGPKDCEVRCSEEDFLRIVTGQLSARRAYLAGRLQVLGDVGLALRLQGVLQRKVA